MSHESTSQAVKHSPQRKAHLRMAKRQRFDFIADQEQQTVRDASNAFSDTYHSSFERCVHGMDELK